MQAYRAPLDRLREALRWFIAVKDVTVLHVVTTTDSRLPALQEINRAQTFERNSSPFVFCEAPAETEPADWDARAAEVHQEMQAAREKAAASAPPIVIPALSEAGHRAVGLGGFAATVRAYSEVLPKPLAGLVVVLAPEAVEDATTWLVDLRRLFSVSGLEGVRFIVVEPEPGPSKPLIVELGRRAEYVDARVDPVDLARRSKVVLAGMKTAPLGAEPIRLAGMAGPREAPPVRVNRTAPSAEQNAKALGSVGLPKGLADAGAMQALRVELASAAIAQQEGRTEEAIAHQRDARDLAARAGLARESLVLDLMLGAHLVQAQGYAAALGVFERVAEQARKEALPTLEVQAYLAKGGTLLAQGKPHEAASTYTKGGQIAEAANLRPFAIECYRMVGQILASEGNEAQAGTAFHRALSVARGTPAHERAISSAPAAARQLAGIYLSHGLRVQAGALTEQAKKWQSELPNPEDARVADTGEAAPKGPDFGATVGLPDVPGFDTTAALPDIPDFDATASLPDVPGFDGTDPPPGPPNGSKGRKS